MENEEWGQPLYTEVSSMVTRHSRFYYEHLFPYEDLLQWLAYGRSEYLGRREISFMVNERYLRYHSFKTATDFKTEVLSLNPQKLDIGAVYTYPPIDNQRVKTTPFMAIERELVLDIDLSDYDAVRYCCQGASVCTKCWRYLSLAMHVLHVLLTEQFGFKHILWVFSGRRGIHAWICDAAARDMTTDERMHVTDTLSLIQGAKEQAKRVSLSEGPLDPILEHLCQQWIQPAFESWLLAEQGILDTEPKWKHLLACLGNPDLEDHYSQLFKRLSSSRERWQYLKDNLSRKQVMECMFQYLYPHLDVNVTKGLNHLLKAPFSLHPSTGRVCVPLDIQTCDEFNPLSVPTVKEMKEEYSKLAAFRDLDTVHFFEDALDLFRQFIQRIKNDP